MYLVKTSIISRAFRYSLNQSGALKQNHVASEHHLSILYYLTLLHFTNVTLLLTSRLVYPAFFPFMLIKKTIKSFKISSIPLYMEK